MAASHVSANGQISPPLNITAPAPLLDLQGFKWTTVDKAAGAAQRLNQGDHTASADDGVFDQVAPQHKAALLSREAPSALLASDVQTGSIVTPSEVAAVPEQLRKQLHAQIGGSHPPFPLEKFQGAWAGNGFNMIWRPRSQGEKSRAKETKDELFPNIVKFKPAPLDDNILELNLTEEQWTFGNTIGDIPNRGLFAQEDITLFGFPYMQTVQDVTNIKSGKGDARDPERGIHFEPGMWLFVPESLQNPNVKSSVVRMASIPHGTTIHAQCLAPIRNSKTDSGGNPVRPNFETDNIRNATPFTSDGDLLDDTFPAMKVKNTSSPRIPQQLENLDREQTITEDIIKNPNIVLKNAIKDQIIKDTISFEVCTGPSPKMNPVAKANEGMISGGGTANIAFLQGDPAKFTPNGPGNPNAHAPFMTSKWWIETVEYDLTIPDILTEAPTRPIFPTMANKLAPTPRFIVIPPPGKVPVKAQTIKVLGTQIQYSQQVNLVFATLTWPHISVATLVPKEPQIWQIK